jgi:hypothetical protein
MGTTTALVRRAVAFELGMYRSLYRWVGRTPRRGTEGGQPFGYAAAVAPVFWLFIGMSALEVVVVHLLLPWRSVQLVLLVLGIWGLVWMVGMLASLKVHLHAVEDGGLRVRYSTSVDVLVPWNSIATVRNLRRDAPSMRAVHVEEADTGVVLKVGVGGETNIDVVLRAPLVLDAPRVDCRPVTEIRFFADDGRGLVARARERVGSVAP